MLDLAAARIPRRQKNLSDRYSYRVGRSNVVIRDADGDINVVPCHKILGLTPDVLEQGKWKRTSDVMVTPGKIAQWIMSQ